MHPRIELARVPMQRVRELSLLTQSKFNCISGICPNMALKGEAAVATSAAVPNPPCVRGVSDILNVGSANAGGPLLFIGFIPLLRSPNVIAAFCFSSCGSKDCATPPPLSVPRNPRFSFDSITPSTPEAFQASSVSSRSSSQISLQRLNAASNSSRRSLPQTYMSPDGLPAACSRSP